MTEAPPADRSDDELVTLVRAGDRRSFGLLVGRHDSAMRRLAFRLMGSQAAMDDALQDAYMKAFRHFDQFDGRSRFSTWLYSITYRTCLDHLRARDRRRELDVAIAPIPGVVAAVNNDPGEVVANRLAVQHALLELPPDQAAVVVLVDGEGHSYESVAEALAIAPGTVASRLSRARAALRERLGADIEGGQR